MTHPLTATRRLPMRYQVLIVGAGPVGQVASLLLADRGVSVGVVERWPAPWPLPRACAIDHEALRTLQGLGLGPSVEPLLDEHGGPGRRIGILDGQGKLLAEGGLRSRSDFGWAEHSSFFQPELESLLLERIAEHANIDLHRGWQVEGMTLHDDGVSAEARYGRVDESGSWQPGDERALVQAEYVIGADGANSIVRDHIRSGLEDLVFSSDWLVVDFRPDEPPAWDPYVGQRLDPRRPTVFVTAGPTVRRFEFMLLPGESPDEMNRPEAAWELLDDWGFGPHNGKLVRQAVYEFGARWADRWRDGRLLLAGDSAHLMPPFLGQGMCSGLRDATALAWRLDLILSGRAPESLLDTYQEERLPHVRQIITDAVRLGKLICVTDPAAAQERDERLLKGGQKELHHRWRLGAGLYDGEDPLGGYLGVQGMVTIDGRTGRLDDLTGGHRWQLLSTVGDPMTHIGPAARSLWERLGGLAAQIAPGAKIADSAGDYQAWFADRGIEVVLMRPDFYVFGSACNLEDTEDLVLRLDAALRSPANEGPGPEGEI